MTTICLEQPTSCIVSEIFIMSRMGIKFCPLSKSLRSAAFPITGRSKDENDSSDILAAVTYHSHLITCPPCYPAEFIAKFVDCHKVLSLQCKCNCRKLADSGTSNINFIYKYIKEYVLIDL